MNFFEWLDKVVSKFKWYDISLVKLTVFFFTLFLLTVWMELRNLVLGIAWYWYLILTIIFAIPLLKKIFK